MRSARLTYAPLAPAHLDALHALVTDEHVRRYLLDGQVFTREWSADRIGDSESLFAQRGVGLWLASEPLSKSVVGFCGFLQIPSDHPEPQLVYALHERFTGQGYATEMARACITEARSSAGFAQVLAGVDAANAASVRVLKKLGFELVSTSVGSFGESLRLRLSSPPPEPRERAT